MVNARPVATRCRGSGRLSPLLALILLANFILPGLVLAQSSDAKRGPGDVEFARLTPGPYLIAWNTALWTSERHPGAGVSGVLELRQEDITYTVEARPGDTSDCLNDHLDLVLTDDEVRDLRIVQEAPTWGQWSAMANFAFTDADAAPDEAKRFARVVCTSWEVGAPGTVIKTVETTDPEHFSTILKHLGPRPSGVWFWGYGRAEEPDSVRLPEHGWEEIGYAIGSVGLGFGSGAQAAITFFPEVGDTALPAPPVGSHNAMLQIDAWRDITEDEAPSDPSNVTLDPATFQVRDERGKLYSATTFRWDEDPLAPADRQRLLAPGELQALTVVFVVPDGRVITDVVCWCAQPYSGSDALGGYQRLGTDFGHVQSPLVGSFVFPAVGDHDVLVAVANTGSQPLAVDPTGWQLVSGQRVSGVSPTSFTWVFPEGTTESGPLELAAGEVAVVLIDFGRESLTNGDSLISTDAADHLTVLASYLQGGGAGGGAPVLIDIE